MKNGQTLIEVLVAVAVGAVLFVGAVSVISPSIKVNTQANRIATQADLQRALLQNVTAWTGGNWNNINSLATTSVNTYYLLTATSPFTATSGKEFIVVGSTTYSRYFYVDNVNRDVTTGNITTSGGTNDPSTKKITAVSNWPGGTTTTIVTYLTRHAGNPYSQVDWSGGGNSAGPVTIVGNQYFENSGMSTTIPGILTISGNSGGSGGINSSTVTHWAWNDLIAWLDTWNNGNVEVNSLSMTGYASSSAGDISFDCATSPAGNICGQSNYQVANNGSGTLSGWAWNDAYGWLSFSGTGFGVTIDASGIFHDYAWNDVFGWTSFNCSNTGSCGSSNYYTQTYWSSSSTLTGYLNSTTFDTGSTNSALNSVVWQGTQPGGTTVQFKFAVSNSSNGPWTYTGSDGTVNTYWLPQGPGTPVSLGSSYTGFRYFRYQVTLNGAGTSTSPIINNVAVSWSP